MRMAKLRWGSPDASTRSIQQRWKEVLNISELKSDPKEEVFVDTLDKDGTNWTGVYVAKILPHSEIPELIPIDGLRVKIMFCAMSLILKWCHECLIIWDWINDKT